MTPPPPASPRPLGVSLRRTVIPAAAGGASHREWTGSGQDDFDGDDTEEEDPRCDSCEPLDFGRAGLSPTRSRPPVRATDGRPRAAGSLQICLQRCSIGRTCVLPRQAWTSWLISTVSKGPCERRGSEGEGRRGREQSGVRETLGEWGEGGCRNRERARARKCESELERDEREPREE